MNATASLSFAGQCLTRLTGPILDKELRVCSRRKRYYALRSLYLAMMGILVLTAWLAKNSSLGWQSSVYSLSRMAEVGRAVIISVVWFQFIVSQIAAVLFFSNAICDEMNRGTLNVLMTTPITTLQIVIGKLLSKLILLVLVLTLSLSTLSIVYVFGGVHWEYIISSFAVTLTAVIFTGTLTLFFSGRVKRPHTVILIVMTFISIYYAMGPSLIEVLSSTSNKGVWLLMANPMAAMYEISVPRVTGAIATGKEFSWGIHCLTMLVISTALVAGTVIRLRKSILTFAFENNRERTSRWARFKRFVLGQNLRYPFILKNLPNSRPRHSLRELILLVLLIAGYAAGYVCLYVSNVRNGIGGFGFGRAIFGTYSMTVWLIVFLKTMVSASTAITKEKENKTLSALLCCPIKNGQIIKGKAKQVYRSNYVGWVVLTLNSASRYLIYSSIYNGASFGPGGIVWMSIFSSLSVVGDLIFILGFGLYLSVRLKSSTATVVAGLLGYLLWYFLRYVVVFIPSVLSAFFGWYMISSYVHPFVDIAVGLFLMRRASRSLRKYAFR